MYSRPTAFSPGGQQPRPASSGHNDIVSRETMMAAALGFDRSDMGPGDADSSDDDDPSNRSQGAVDARMRGGATTGMGSPNAARPPTAPGSQFKQVAAPSVPGSRATDASSLSRALGGDGSFGSMHKMPVGVVIGPSSGGASGGTVAYASYARVTQELTVLSETVAHLEQRLENSQITNKSQTALYKKAMLTQLKDRDAMIDRLAQKVAALQPGPVAEDVLSEAAAARKKTDAAERMAIGGSGAGATGQTGADASTTADVSAMSLQSLQEEVIALRAERITGNERLRLLQREAARLRAYQRETGAVLAGAARPSAGGGGSALAHADLSLLTGALTRFDNNIFPDNPDYMNFDWNAMAASSSLSSAATATPTPAAASSASALVAVPASSEQSIGSTTPAATGLAEAELRATKEKLAKSQQQIELLKSQLSDMTRASGENNARMQAAITEKERLLAQMHDTGKAAPSNAGPGFGEPAAVAFVAKSVEEIDPALIEAVKQEATAAALASAATAAASAASAADEELQSLRSQISELAAKLESSTAAAAELQQQLQSARADTESKQSAHFSEVQALKDTVAQREEAISSLQKRAAALEQQVAASSGAAAHSQEEQSAMESQMSELRSSAALDRAKLVDLEKQLLHATTEAMEAKNALEAAKNALEAAKVASKAREEKIKASANAQFEALKGQFLGELEEREKELLEIKESRDAVAKAHGEEVQKLQNEMVALRSVSNGLMGRVQAMAASLSLVRSAHAGLKSQVQRETSAMSQQLRADLGSLQSSLASVASRYDDLQSRYKKELAERRRLFNVVQELKGNIRVYCRVRPALPFELHDGNNVCVRFPEEGEICVSNTKKQTKTWEFDCVFQPGTPNETVFKEVEGLVTSALDGYNVCIFAYGQTGSGKTFTMEGSPDSPGINYRTLDALFAQCAARPDMRYEISVSMLEIYNEQVRDMMNGGGHDGGSGPGAGDGKGARLQIREGPQGMYVPDLTITSVTSREEVLDIMRQAYANRTTFATNMNEHSSRSHCVLSVYVNGTSSGTKQAFRGKLHLIDLAGSERVGKSGATGDRLKEAQAINKSLSALGDVIQARMEKRSHVPFRNSTLTQLLSDSLSGDSKTLMFVNLSPVISNAEETFCSLNFASRVRNVELGKASKHVSGSAASVSTPQGSDGGDDDAGDGSSSIDGGDDSGPAGNGPVTPAGRGTPSSGRPPATPVGIKSPGGVSGSAVAKRPGIR